MAGLWLNLLGWACGRDLFLTSTVAVHVLVLLEILGGGGGIGISPGPIPDVPMAIPGGLMETPTPGGPERRNLRTFL